MKLERFRDKVQYYLKLSGIPQKALAQNIPMHPTVLSNKLSGTGRNAPFTKEEVRQIIKVLAGWQAITTQNEALDLLHFMGMGYNSFSPTEWTTAPLNVLERLITTMPLPLSASRETPVQFEHEARAANRSTWENWFGTVEIEPFYGRQTESSLLEEWLLIQRSPLLGIFGMGGMGKTTLAFQVARNIKNLFDFVFWRSLSNAPSSDEIITDCLKLLAGPTKLDLPDNLDGQLRLLKSYLLKSRCLIVLDNFETVLEQGVQAGYYREGYAGYGALLKTLGEGEHQSCLLLTSREKPQEFSRLEGRFSSVRSLELGGLDLEQVRQALASNRLTGSVQAWQQLLTQYSGNPLALKLVAPTIRDLFNSDIDQFVQKGWLVFDDIRDLLSQQLGRLTPTEEHIIYWLALERTPVDFQTLLAEMILPVTPKELIEALTSLRRRSLITRTPDEAGAFYLQPVVMEYMTESLLAKLEAELLASPAQTDGVYLRHYRLLKANTKDYLRNAQTELILKPLGTRLLQKQKIGGRRVLERHITDWLAALRQLDFAEQGYAPGNLLNLLIALKINVADYDFSRLQVWQAYLREVELPGVSFAGSDLSQSLFREDFRAMMAVALSPDDAFLAITSHDEIIVWEFATGRQLLRVKGHSDWVRALNFSPDSRLLASGSDDRTVRLWEVESGRCLAVLTEHTDRVGAVVFSTDGNLLFTSSNDKTIRVWEVPSVGLVATLYGHNNWVAALDVSPDGRWLASGSSDGLVKIWQKRGYASYVPIFDLHGHSEWLVDVRFSPDSRTLASSSADGTLRLWRVEDGQNLAVLEGHTDWVEKIVFSPDGTLLLSASDDKTVRFWDVAAQQCYAMLQGHNGSVRGLALNSAGTTLVTIGSDQCVKFWDIANRQCNATWQGYSGWVRSVAISPDGRLIASAANNGLIRLWKRQTGELLQTLYGHASSLAWVAFSPDGKYLASSSSDQSLKLWDVARGICLYTIQGETNWLATVTFSPDGSQIVSANQENMIKIWEVATGELVRGWHNPTGWVGQLIFSPDGKYLATGGYDKTVKIWDTTRGELIYNLEGHHHWICRLAFSPDGRLLASGSDDMTVRIWDVESGRHVQTLAGHTSSVYGLVFSSSGSGSGLGPESERLATGGQDGLIKMWDIGEGAELASWVAHAGGVNALVFDPLTTCLISGGRDSTVKSWQLPDGELSLVLTDRRPYENMNIADIKGLTAYQRKSLQDLGARLT